MQDAEFDFIVVGGGSGGSVVATRLVQAGHSVLILEAGRSDNHIYVKAPAGLFMLSETGHAFAHETVPQRHANNRVMYVPTGHTLGGGSSVNGMVYMRGQPEDYDGWQQMGNAGWAWNDVLPFFKKAENNQRLAGEMHGTSGPLTVSDPTHRHALSLAFVQAAQQSGHDFNHDFNQGNTSGNQHGQLGVGFFQTTTKQGTRASTSAAYLSQVRKDNNLTIKVKSPVSRILIKDGRAVGVCAHLNNGPETTIKARHGVVLAAGAFITPKILMHSGLGDGAHLQEHGIKVEIHLPGVGQNLHDHLEVQIEARTKQPISLLGQNKGWRRLRHGIEWLLFKQGMLTSTIVEVGGFFDTTGNGRPDVQIHVIPCLSGDVDRQPPQIHGISIDPGFLQPKSRGTVRLRSADPRDKPLIDPHFLEAQEDVDTLVRGIKLTREILKQPALADILNEELLPGASITSDADLESFARQYAKTAYHPVGTCRMGTDDLAVVDPQLKLHGADNIWISDASVMPRLVSGNTNAPTIMIGERAADFILRSLTK